ncbi:tubulin polyglutamylase complex subunit 1-like [Biomphalaria glabrata]|uniref:Tubulin polyglutamylase complex subunit 1-like n=1 Tax=Biomphalaria glabrata TaxID=6526 RepID=A0A9W2Z4J4_BIOGL|nr:tubulin polyglutamylase complex subunit 1-like [Biomphalaria glabrata]
MADRRKNLTGQTVEIAQESERQFMEKHNVSSMLKDVVTKLLANRPVDPLSFLANYFRSSSSDYRIDDIVMKAVQTLTSTHYSRPVFETNLITAFQLLSNSKLSKRLRGMNGAIHKQVLQALCKDVPAPVQEKLLKKIECFDHEAISFSIFRSTVFTCFVLNDFLTLSKSLYTTLDLQRNGKAQKTLCQTSLQQLRESLSNSKKDVHRIMESSYNLGPDTLYSVIDKAMSENTSQGEYYSHDQFVIEASDIFLSKVKQLH